MSEQCGNVPPDCTHYLVKMCAENRKTETGKKKNRHFWRKSSFYQYSQSLRKSGILQKIRYLFQGRVTSLTSWIVTIVSYKSCITIQSACSYKSCLYKMILIFKHGHQHYWLSSDQNFIYAMIGSYIIKTWLHC